jgi:hypothetical protein
MTFAIAVLAIVGSDAVSTPASAAAKEKDVVAACKRTKGCGIIDTGNGTSYGCSPHACFSCSNGKCTQTRRTGNVPLTNRATANGTQIYRGNTAPANLAAPSNNPMRMGGRH